MTSVILQTTSYCHDGLISKINKTFMHFIYFSLTLDDNSDFVSLTLDDNSDLSIL